MTRPMLKGPLVGLILISILNVAEAQYKARPVISSVQPTTGPPGTTVTVAGKHFGPEYKIYFNGVELKPIKSDAAQFVVKIPGDAVQGRFAIKGPIHQVVSPQVFWVVASQVAPVISGISPSIGPPGTVVTLKGKHFSTKAYENAVSINGVPLQVRAASEGRIEAIIAVGAKTGNVTVQVYNAGQATSQKTFTVLAQLKVDSVEPAAGPPGTRVTLTGSGFSAKKKNNTVTLAGKKCKILKAAPGEIVVEIPTRGAKTGRFAIVVKGLGKTEHGAVFPVAYPPEVGGFSPASGNVGQDIAIKGRHFGFDRKMVQVLLTGRQCQVLSFADNEIHVRVPQGSVSGPFEVIVKGMGSAASSKNFEVWAPLAVTRMDPMLGLPGTEIKIWGTGFRSTAAHHTVLIGSKTVKIDRIDAGALIFKIPQDAPDGRISLRLEVKDRGATMIAMPLTVMHSPQVTGFSPQRGPAGTIVTITGNYFGTKTNHVRVMLGKVVVPVTAVSPTMIQASIPQNAASGQFEVQTVRRGKIKSKKSFETFVPVRLTNFLPSMGYPGQVVNLFGNGFETVSKRNTVTLGGKKVKVLEASQTRLKIKLPKGISTGKFRIEVPQRGFVESPLSFSVIDKLAIKSFTPATGLPGAYVTIKGKGFQNQGLRGYVGQKPIGVRVDSPTQVTIAIPPQASDGPFVFTAPGAGRAESSAQFKVLIPLTVTGFMPTSGSVGTKVSIYGTGFDLRPKKTKVNFGGLKLPIEAGSSESMLVVTIPKGAKAEAFKVIVQGKGDVESENLFAVQLPQARQKATAVATASRPPTQQPATPAPAAPTPATAQSPSKKAQPPSMDALMGVTAKGEKPKISSLEPAEGPIGETIMINGSGFGEDPGTIKAWLGHTPATIVGAVPDMVMIEVPGGVKRGKIRLKVGSHTTIASTQLFKVTE